jgi:hypothetical protein
MNPITTIRRTVATTAALAALAIGLGAGGADAASGSVGPHSAARATCGTVEIRSTAPTVKAVNRTAAVDQQWVVVQPVLYRWNGSAWAQSSTYTAIMGLATDAKAPTVWYDFVTRAQTSPSSMAMMTQSGSYKLAYNYWWYTGNTITGSDSLWATHTSPIGAVTSYCSR